MLHKLTPVLSCRLLQILYNSKSIHAHTIDKTPVHAYSYHPPKQAITKAGHIDCWHLCMTFPHHAFNCSLRSCTYTGLLCDEQAKPRPDESEASKATCYSYSLSSSFLSVSECPWIATSVYLYWTSLWLFGSACSFTSDLSFPWGKQCFLQYVIHSAPESLIDI